MGEDRHAAGRPDQPHRPEHVDVLLGQPVPLAQPVRRRTPRVVVATSPARISACAMCGRPTVPPAAPARISGPAHVDRRRRAAASTIRSPRSSRAARTRASSATSSGSVRVEEVREQVQRDRRLARRTSGRTAPRRGPGVRPGRQRPHGGVPAAGGVVVGDRHARRARRRRRPGPARPGSSVPSLAVEWACRSIRGPGQYADAIRPRDRPPVARRPGGVGVADHDRRSPGATPATGDGAGRLAGEHPATATRTSRRRRRRGSAGVRRPGTAPVTVGPAGTAASSGEPWQVDQRARRLPGRRSPAATARRRETPPRPSGLSSGPQPVRTGARSRPGRARPGRAGAGVPAVTCRRPAVGQRAVDVQDGAVGVRGQLPGAGRQSA